MTQEFSMINFISRNFTLFLFYEKVYYKVYYSGKERRRIAANTESMSTLCKKAHLPESGKVRFCKAWFCSDSLRERQSGVFLFNDIIEQSRAEFRNVKVK